MLSTQAFAQTTFFTLWPGHPSFSPLPTPNVRALEGEFQIAVDIRALALNSAVRQQFSVRLPDDTSKVFQQQSFDGQAGFISLGETDIQPDTALPDSAISYYWYGLSGKETLSVAVYRGRMSATLIGQRKTYQITESAGRMVFRRFNPRLFAIDAVGSNAAPAFEVPKNYQIPNSQKFFDTISVLVLHTPAALAQAGSQAQLNAEIAQAFGQSDTALSNSGITSYKLVNVATGTNLSQVITYNEAPATPAGCNVALVGGLCRWIGHRVFLRTNAAVQAARNAAGADLVVMLVADQADATGVAYVQRPDCGNELQFESTAGCSVGTGYNPFAVSAVSLTYINSFQVFAHETGHQMGMEHNVANGSPAASFPWSYGWFVENQNETVMSVAGAFSSCTNCPRALHYSNPNIPFVNSLVPSGTAASFNARTAAFLAPTVSEFRNPVLTGLIFRAGFESLPIP